MDRYVLKLLLLAVAPILFVFWACTPPGIQGNASAHFPIRGKHVTVSCDGCHIGDLQSASPQCASCHEGDRPAAPHDQNDDCAGCHDEEGWDCAAPQHHNFFPLVNAHDLVCADCHGPECTTSPKPSTVCESCHASDSPPGHYTAGCKDCHEPTRWRDAGHNHEQFIVPHEGRSKCEGCHTNPANDSFSCTTGGCHEHTKPDMDDEHQGKNGYAYETPKCYNCHPQGRE